MRRGYIDRVPDHNGARHVPCSARHRSAGSPPAAVMGSASRNAREVPVRSLRDPCARHVPCNWRAHGEAPVCRGWQNGSAQKECPPRRWGPRGASGAFAWAAPPWWCGRQSTIPSWSPLSRVRPRGKGAGPCELHARPTGARRIHPLADLLEHGVVACHDCCRVRRSPQRTPDRSDTLEIRLPFHASGASRSGVASSAGLTNARATSCGVCPNGAAACGPPPALSTPHTLVPLGMGAGHPSRGP
jgi:hypothetical protein